MVFVGQVGVTPNVVTIASSESLATITSAGWIDKKPTVEKLSASNYVLALYDFNPPANQGTFGWFTASIVAGVTTLVPNYAGLSPSNPAIKTVASVTPGSYVTGNILVSGDDDGSIAPGSAEIATQFRAIDDAVLVSDAALGVGMTLSAPSLTSGDSTGAYSYMTFAANAGAKVTGFTADVTATGNLGATSITSALTSVMNVGGNAMTSGAILTGHYIDANAPSNVTGITADFCATYVKGPQTGSMGSLISVNGKVSHLLNLAGAPGMFTTPTGVVMSGTLGALSFTNGVNTFYIPCATVLGT